MMARKKELRENANAGTLEVKRGSKDQPDEIFPVAAIQSIMFQVMQAVMYMNSEWIVLRMLSPMNVCFPSGTTLETMKMEPEMLQIKIIGFGQCHDDARKNPSRFLTLGGEGIHNCALGVAPEVLAQQQCTAKADAWSCGVIMYWLIAQAWPFAPDRRYFHEKATEEVQVDREGGDVVALLENIEACDAAYPPEVFQDETVVNILKKLLVKEQDKRDEVKKVLA